MEEIKSHYLIEEAHDVANDVDIIKDDFNRMKDDIKEFIVLRK